MRQKVSVVRRELEFEHSDHPRRRLLALAAAATPPRRRAA